MQTLADYQDFHYQFPQLHRRVRSGWHGRVRDKHRFHSHISSLLYSRRIGEKEGGFSLLGIVSRNGGHYPPRLRSLFMIDL